ncbi:unnamed protein product, partial [Rotaria magnacalcarata]
MSSSILSSISVKIIDSILKLLPLNDGKGLLALADG